MKQLKKLTRNQKIIMSKLGYNAKQYGLVMDDGSMFVAGLKEDPNKQTFIRYTSSTTGREFV